ncbi:hypothetical protein [Mycobacterium vicinigordonae]|uniref:Mammalian cell entry protein n=1 Tax=Mycobacterium vicinigordonae TaxID=1719132 RepID=A0A7D6IAN8_9MYCO|nr:hypothetical protein [Mycobacterium vicinigordonae]QLL09896.1 hypothetical protein H0P51_00570 [Mycobacterium vicinigordonae]
MILTIGAGYLKWQDSSFRSGQLGAAEATRVASTSTVKLLSYKAETVESDLNAARDLLTSKFKDAYTSLVHDVVIPGSRQKKISATAQVSAASPLAASADHAQVLVFVNQTVVIGEDPPTNTASSVRVTLDKVQGRWLIAQFDPI